MKTAREYANAIRVNYLLGQAEEDRIAADFEQAMADARRAALEAAMEVGRKWSGHGEFHHVRFMGELRALLDDAGTR